MKRILSILMMLIVIMTVSAKDIKTVTYTVNPAMHCNGCVAKIKNQLKFEKGVKSIDISLEEQIVTLQYDAEKVQPKKFVELIKKAGYEATEVKPVQKKEEKK